jgi:hypothetical protein
MNKLALLLFTAALFGPGYGQGSNADKSVKGQSPQMKPALRPLMAGQVKGVLYHPNGTRFAEGVSVFVGDVVDEAKNKVSIDAELSHKTNRRGEFTLEKVMAGRHGLCIFIPPQPGEKPQQIGLIINKTKPTYFTMPANAGIDLGHIEVTSIRQ